MNDAATRTLTTPEDFVDWYRRDLGFQLVCWDGTDKGPERLGWQHEAQQPYRAGQQVGAKLGPTTRPGVFLIDVDIDWAPGSSIAQALLPPTAFLYGRASKRISHCFYTVPAPISSIKYADPVDKTTLIELRGTKADGSVGFQTVLPPSINVDQERGTRERLEFVRCGPPTHLEAMTAATEPVALTAVGMLLAKNFGHNGFGHETRLAWSGCLLRLGVPVETLIRMGEAVSRVCNNQEVDDVRRVVESTERALARGDKKVKGGPALIKILGRNGRKIVEAICGWLGRERDFVRNERGIIVPNNQENITRALELCEVELRYDEFSERVLIQEAGGTPCSLQDAELESLWLRIEREHLFRPEREYFRTVLHDIARQNRFHPVRDYLDSLTWDGEPRIDRWLTEYGGAVDERPPISDSDDRLTYVEAVSSLTLNAAVKRIYEPGCKYDEMAVLEGEQGVNKSTALRTLCPRDEWFTDDLSLRSSSKELIEHTLGKWIVEASDLAGLKKQDVEELKRLLSAQVDGPARMAYARMAVERPRHFVIIGSTNSAEYLVDSTGARRFWPVRIKQFDIEKLRRDRDQLWAEAVARVKAGESIRLPEHLWPLASEHQEKRRAADPWEQALKDAIRGVNESGDGRRRVTAEQLFRELGLVDVSKRDRTAQIRVSQIMQRLGFKRGSVKDTKTTKVVTGYIERNGRRGLMPEEPEPSDE